MLLPNKSVPFERSTLAIAALLLKSRSENYAVSNNDSYRFVSQNLRRHVHIEEFLKAEVFLYITGRRGELNEA